MRKLGPWSFVGSGALFLGNAILEFVLGPPPAGAEIAVWASQHHALLAMIDEAFVLGAVLLVPASIGLRTRFDRADNAASVGCALVALTFPIYAVLGIVLGRLVYPVYGLRAHTADSIELVVALYVGGMHLVALVLAVATLALSLALRRDARDVWDARIARLGFASAALDVLGAYPDRIGPTAKLVADVVFAGWLLAMGVGLNRWYRAAAGEVAG